MGINFDDLEFTFPLETMLKKKIKQSFLFCPVAL